MRLEKFDLSILPDDDPDASEEDDSDEKGYLVFCFSIQLTDQSSSQDAVMFSKLRATYPMREIGYFKDHPPTATSKHPFNIYTARLFTHIP
jgi:hypothetical protein